MKKILALLISVVMACGMLAGCGSTPVSSSESSTAPSESSESSEPAPEETGWVITAAEDLYGKKIGVQAGTTGETFVTENITDAEILSYKTGIDASLDLKAGALDAVVIDELPAKSIVDANDDLQIVDINLAIEEYAIAVKKGNTELLNSINATIAKIKGDGTYESLVAAFMPADGNIVIPEALATEGDTAVIMGTSTGFPPFEYTDGAGDPVGFDISMSQLIAADMGVKLQVEDMAFDSLLSALDTGVIDFAAAGMSITEERLASVDFSEPYYSSKQVIIIKK
ncbi:MAG: transporter substrate-binding domain-containing protein [Oscillospiraceae bacterium]|nr:transporter substrate-binding domain-containing protein [Oscillospiraceae bacterium]